jgi:hypothetical protein
MPAKSSIGSTTSPSPLPRPGYRLVRSRSAVRRESELVFLDSLAEQDGFEPPVPVVRSEAAVTGQDPNPLLFAVTTHSEIGRPGAYGTGVQPARPSMSSPWRCVREDSFPQAHLDQDLFDTSTGSAPLSSWHPHRPLATVRAVGRGPRCEARTNCARQAEADSYSLAPRILGVVKCNRTGLGSAIPQPRA